MYKAISIKNFRCFEETTINGFEQINLIGGQNNAGKTALLEALYLGGEPTSKTIYFLEFSNRKKAEYPIDGNNIWKDIFYSFNTESIVNINITSNQGSENVNITTFDDQFTKVMLDDIENGTSSNDLFVSFTKNLKIEFLNKNNERFLNHIYFRNGEIEFENNLNITDNKSYYFITNTKLNGKSIANLFDRAKFNNRHNQLLAFCQTIDEGITAIDTYQNEIYIKHKNNMTNIPLRLWGDAMNKVLGYFLIFLEINLKAILIDEIENGIHHSNQVVFWTILFDLAKEFDVQVFATSHSAEMIQAFQAVATKSNIKGAYFELSRHAKTNKILGIKTQLDTLELKLNHHQNFRGE
jgi:AAA15 family ATPase/GTPase